MEFRSDFYVVFYRFIFDFYGCYMIHLWDLSDTLCVQRYFVMVFNMGRWRICIDMCLCLGFRCDFHGVHTSCVGAVDG